MASLEEDLITIASMVWDSFFDTPVTESREALDQLRRPAPTYTGIVTIAGAWQGAVVVRCARELAFSVSESMFGIERGEASPDDIRDAIGEVTNMIGGNIKSLLPEPSKLGLPMVGEGTDYGLSMPGTEVKAEVGLSCDFGYLLVSIREKQDQTMVDPG
jgi:chemotaxis protein CheX